MNGIKKILKDIILIDHHKKANEIDWNVIFKCMELPNSVECLIKNNMNRVLTLFKLVLEVDP